MSVRVTLTGRAVAKSGLLPSTADELMRFLSLNAQSLSNLNTACAESDLEDCDDFAFVLLHAAYSSTEYGRSPVQRRYLAYQLLTGAISGPHGRVRSLLFSPSESDAVNAAILTWRWIRGGQMRQLESALDIRSGVLTGMFADGANILRGIADVLFAATSVRSATELPTSIEASTVGMLRGLIPTIRRLASRVDKGLPDDVVWISTLSDGGSVLLSRQQIISLREADLQGPTDILDPSRFPQLLDALGARSAANQALAQALQQATRNWRVEERNRLIERQKRQLPVECRDLLLRFYRAREVEFERVLAEILECFSIGIEAIDDGTINSFPDFIITPCPPQTLAIECKSKTVGESVTFNDATDVIRKAGVNGYRDAFKVTVCQPYISPDVPRRLTNCPDLCVVNAEDIAEAFVRMKLGQLSVQAFSDWIGRPGQALCENLVTNSAPLAA